VLHELQVLGNLLQSPCLPLQRQGREMRAGKSRHSHAAPCVLAHYRQWLDVVATTLLRMTPGFATGWLLCSVYIVGVLDDTAAMAFFAP